MIIIAETIRGINVKIGSDTSGLSAALKDVNKNSRSIAGELRKVERLLKFNPKNTELLSQKQKLLSDQVETTREKLNRLKTAQEQVNQQFQKGDITEGQYRAFQRELVKTESQLEHYESQLKSATKASSAFGKKTQEVGNKLKSAGNKMKSIGQKMSGISAVIGGAFTALTVGTRDFRKELSVLENNTRTAGANMDNMSKAMKQMQGVTGELDSNVEGLSNLLAAGFKGDKFQQVLDELSGAAIKFKDTLKFEGIADGLQETLATGNAVGPFAELLERSGIQLDGFNAGLQEAIKNGTQQNYILGTLANTGLANVYEQYRKNNKELVESAEAQYSLQESLAKLGKTLEPIMTTLTNLATSLVDKFNNLSPVGEKIAIVLGGLAVAAGPVLMAIGTMTTGIGSLVKGAGKLPGILNKVKTALAGVSLSSIGTVAGIAALAVIAVEVYRNWGEAKKVLLGIFDTLKNAVKTLVSFWKLEFTALKAAVLTVIEAIVNKLSILEKIPGIGDKFKSLSDAIGDSAEKARAEVGKMADELKGNAGKVVDSAKNTGAAFADMGKAVKNDIAGVIGAITGHTKVVEEETEKQTEAVEDGAKEQTEAIKEETEEQRKARESFEKEWTQKLAELTQTRLDKINESEEKALAEAKKRNAKTADIEEYFYQKRLAYITDFSAESLSELESQKAKALEIAQKYGIKEVDVLQAISQKEEKLRADRNQKREEFEQSWQQKLEEYNASEIEKLEAEKQEALQNADELGAKKSDIKKLYAQKELEVLMTSSANTIEELNKEKGKALEIAEGRGLNTVELLEFFADRELEIEEKKQQAKEEFEQSWSDKLYNLTHSRLEILAKEREQAITEAKKKGAETNAIEEAYAIEALGTVKTQKINSIEELKQQKAEALKLADELGIEKSRIIEMYSNKAVGLFNNEKVSTLEELQDQKEQTLLKYDELGLEKTAIIQYYADERQKILGVEDKAVQKTAKAWADSYMNIVGSVVDGTKTIKEVLKDLLVQFLEMKQKEVLIQQMGELAKAFATSWIDWSAVARAGAAIAASTAAFEGAKALVKGLKDGAVIPARANQLYRLGDGREDEAAIPLNDKVLGAIGAGIAANMPQQQVVATGGGGRDIHIHVGTLVADDYSVKKFGRKIREVIIAEDKRRGR